MHHVSPKNNVLPTEQGYMNLFFALKISTSFKRMNLKKNIFSAAQNEEGALHVFLIYISIHI